MTHITTFGIFPLIRKLSRPFVVLFLRLPVTPNQITTLSLITGLGAAICFLQSDYKTRLIGALLFVVCYLLDNCDGEIARIKHLGSKFGDYYDTFVDWIVHTSLFLALGYSNYRDGDDMLWLWLGLFAGAGASINYILGLLRDKEDQASPVIKTITETPTFQEFFILIFRELTRADFCFLLLILTLFDYEWILLPVAAIGAQIYWMTRFAESARKFHV
jgi:phosphatidylglycerophosphate synthase